MNRYLKKNGKKVMAILGVLLMIAFMLPSASKYSGDVATVATLYNGDVKLDSKEYRRYMGEWAHLKNPQNLPPGALFLILGGGDVTNRTQGLLERNRLEFGQRVFAEIDQNEEAFALLAKEAERLGIVANTDQVENLLMALGLSADADATAYNNMRLALTDLMSVAASANRASSVVKVSQPARDQLKASRMQELSLNLVEFNAKDFLDKVAAPTPDQIQAQFDKYKNVEADNGPDGFGYKYPNRVKYDAVVVRRDDVKKGIAPVELDQVYEYYLRNKNSSEFVTEKPATQPDAFSLSTGPTTRPMTMDEAKEKIITRLTNQRVDELSQKVSDAVRGTMRADYDAYKAGTASGSKVAPASSLGVAYNSFEYLQKLRDKVQADHKVTVAIEQQDAWQSPKTLSESPLAKYTYDTQAGGSIPLPTYLTALVETFLTEEQRKALSARSETRPIGVWEPTPVFRSGDDQLVARVAAAEATHTPKSIEEVREKVIADAKLAAANAKAKEAAQAVLDAAKSGKWLQSVANEQNKKMVTTGPLRADMVNTPDATIPNTALKGRAAQQFLAGAFKLLAEPPRQGSAARPATTRATTQAAAATTQPTGFKEHPIGLIELPAEGKVIVAEVDDLKARWTKEDQSFTDAFVTGQERMATELILRSQWFNYDNITQRTGYNPTEKRERKNRSLPPLNPFTGTMLR